LYSSFFGSFLFGETARMPKPSAYYLSIFCNEYQGIKRPHLASFSAGAVFLFVKNIIDGQKAYTQIVFWDQWSGTKIVNFPKFEKQQLIKQSKTKKTSE